MPAIVPATAYTQVQTSGRLGDCLAAALAPAVKVAPKSDDRTWIQWAERELRSGGLLHEYLRREKARTVDRQRAVSRSMVGRRPNARSDFELVARVPAREFFRWKREDPHFWDDDANLRSLKRDNPDLAPCITLGPAPRRGRMVKAA